MAGRKPGFRHQDEVRRKIQASALVTRLHSIAMGTADATPAQVNAAKSLLNKVLPDLKSTELTGGLHMLTNPEKLTDEQLAAIATTGSATPSKQT